MPYKNKEDEIAFQKEYYKKNKEKINARNNKNYKKNRLNVIANQKLYQLTSQGRKNKRIWDWQNIGVIEPDLDTFYEYFLSQTHCWICFKKFNQICNMDYRCLDHDHDLIDEPNIRYICCGYCNINVIR